MQTSRRAYALLSVVRRECGEDRRIPTPSGLTAMVQQPEVCCDPECAGGHNMVQRCKENIAPTG